MYNLSIRDLKGLLIKIQILGIFLILTLSIYRDPILISLDHKISSHPILQQGIEERMYNATGTYDITQFANYSQQKSNITEIDIDLPPNNWNVTRLDLDFKNISLNEEKLTIEGGLGNDWQGLENGEVEELAMQLKLSEFTIIYSVDILGFKAETNPNPGVIYFEIKGWDTSENEPIGPIEGQTELNMSGELGWYTQTFTEPIELAAGDYALVLNGLNIETGDYYFWRLNDSKVGSNLYMSYYENYIGPFWRWTEVYESVFCHRINRWINKSYNPSELNMSIEIDNINYPISDGAPPGTGNVIIKNLNLVPSGNNLYLPIVINKSLRLNFDFNFTLGLIEITNALSTVQIGDNTTNYWYLYPEIERVVFDQLVQIRIPQNWYNLQVFKNGLNLTDDPNILFLNDILYIHNDIIDEESDWVISAMNLLKLFFINSSKASYSPAEDLLITVESSFLQGEYFLRIIDADNNTLYEEMKLVDSEIESFNYLIRNDAIEGMWTVIVYWSNQTDAGFEITRFNLVFPKINPPFDPTVIIIIVAIGGGVASLSYGTYKIVELHKKKEEERNKNLVNKVKDLTNLQYLLIVDKVSSLDLFTQSFSTKKLDLSLVSGFLDAIKSFGIELTESYEQSQIIKLEYQKSKIIMSEYKGFRLIIIMKDNPSYDFLDLVKKLLVSIDEKFGRFLVDFKGDIRPFKYVERLIVQLLGTSFVYPLKILDREKVKLNSAEKVFLNRAKNYMKSINNDYIFVSHLINVKKLNPIEIAIINSLIKKRLFEPIIGYHYE
jgi:hypothetical protein